MFEYALTQSVSVSFQRYPFPAAGVVTALAPSWGALPFLPSAPHQLVLPCPNGEALWIGLVTSARGRHRLQIPVSTASGDRVDALAGAPADDTEPAGTEGLRTPPPHGVPGILLGDGSWWAFAHHTGESSAPA